MSPPTATVSSAESTAWVDRLIRLGLSVQEIVCRRLAESAVSGNWELAEAVAEEGGDRIYAIDRDVEPVLLQEIEAWPAECLPLVLIAEGLNEDGRQIIGPTGGSPRYRVIIDPIDGTRMLMYDKRSAWFIAAVALNRGEETSLADTFASVLVELPTTKQTQADIFSATSHEPTQGRRLTAGLGPASLADAVSIPVKPSQATTLHDGFVTVVGFFPGTRSLAADLCEFIAEQTGANGVIPQFFDDQYISTGGQMVNLMTGRDRCCLDLRPLFNEMLGRERDDRFLEAHPYDLAGLLAAHQAGALVTDDRGARVSPPLDVETGCGWCGFANSGIRELLLPLIAEWRDLRINQSP